MTATRGTGAQSAPHPALNGGKVGGSTPAFDRGRYGAASGHGDPGYDRSAPGAG